jgi:hypothetical protein
MFSLAGYLRSLAEKGTYDLDDIVEKYENWVLDDRYMVMVHQREQWLTDGGELEYVAVKCAKRGNDVYVSRVNARLYGIGRHVPEIQHDFHKDPFTSMLFVTLTYDTKLCDFAEAWKDIGEQFNRYKANLRKKYGEFSVMRTWESYENGFPHVHAILLFDKRKFRVFPSYEPNKKGELRLVWRIHDKHEFEPYWHSWQDIKAVYNVRGGLNYLKKYIMKCAEYAHDDVKSRQTLAMCWVFRKKAFYVSGKFRKALSDLITALCSSKTRKIQLNLLNEELKSNPWKVLGFIGTSFLDFDVEVWTFKLTTEQMQSVFSEWEKVNHYE